MKNDLLEVQTKKTDDIIIKSKKNQEKKTFTALCTNCDERFNCKIRNNASIIWHCEEYK